MKKSEKYVLHGGWIQSKNDGDWHWISAYMLLDLYRLPRNECILAEPSAFNLSLWSSGYVHLFPLYHGVMYELVHRFLTWRNQDEKK